MTQSITLWGATYGTVDTLQLPKTGSGTASFIDTTISSNAAAASDITSGKQAWVNGSLLTGTNSGGGGTDRLVLINTTSIGTLSTTSTSGVNSNVTVTLNSATNWDDYDLLIVDCSVNTPTNNRHTSTVSMVLLTGTSSVGTKNTYTVVSNKWNTKLSSGGAASSRQSTTAYGVYVNSASVSSTTLSLPIYYKYNNNSTGTLNGTYTARVYGIKLIDLIGG